MEQEITIDLYDEDVVKIETFENAKKVEVIDIKIAVGTKREIHIIVENVHHLETKIY